MAEFSSTISTPTENNKMIEILQYLSIPVVAGLIGWTTNKVCIMMTLGPTKFIGIKPPYLGWQGIIPARTGEVATGLTEIFINKLLKMQEIFQRIEVEQLIEELEPALPTIARDIVDTLMMEQAPDVWVAMPLKLKEGVYREIEARTPRAIRNTVAAIGENIEEVFDLESMLMDVLTRDRKLLIGVIEKLGSNEFKFIINSGAYFGFLFGTIQMFVWMGYQAAWILPAVGVLVGTITNYLAIHMVFEPVKPVPIGPLRIFGKSFGPLILQGVFIKRRKEVAVDMGKVMAKEVMNPKNITRALLKGPASDHLFLLIERQVRYAMDSNTGFAKPFVTLGLGTKRYVAIQDKVVDQVIENIPLAMTQISDYTQEAIDIESLLEEKMALLTEEEFAGIMRPIFHKDEWKLIALGSVLGLGIGMFQLYFVWGGAL
jgi:uncharacterized membrane protein YheB (UPF0754 family)